MNIFKLKNILFIAGAVILAILAITQYSSKKQKQANRDAGYLEIERRKNENLKSMGAVYTLKNAPAAKTKPVGASALPAATTTTTGTGTSAPAKVPPFVTKFPRKTMYVVFSEGLTLRLALSDEVTAELGRRLRSILSEICLAQNISGLDSAACPLPVQSPLTCAAQVVRPALMPGLGIQAIEKPIFLNCYPKENCLKADAKPSQLKLEPATGAESLSVGEIIDVIWSEERCPPAEPAKPAGPAPAFYRAQNVFLLEK